MQKKVRKLYGKTGRGTFLGSSRVKWAKQNKWQSWVINFYWCSECRSTFFTIYWNWKTLKGSVYAGGHGWTWNLHVCQNAWHVMGYWAPSKSNPPSPKIFNSPRPHSPQTFYSRPPTGNGCFCIFHTWLLPTSNIFEAIITDQMLS